jgi:pimeloyl-ACP methyl ester carboxylesterase
MKKAILVAFVVLTSVAAVLGLLSVLGNLWITHREPDSLDRIQDQLPGRLLVVGERRVHLVEEGSGPPVLLVHGFAGSTFDWEEHLLPQLAVRYRTVAIDLYGMGFSERSPDLEYGFDLWLEQLASTLDALQIERASLIGHSLGGAIVARFASDRPHRVDRLVLVAGLAPSAVWETPWWFLAMATPGVGELLVSRLDHLPALPGFSDAYHERAAAAYRLAGSRRAVLTYVRRGAEFARLREAYPRIRCPALFIHGTRDDNVPYAAVERVVSLVPDGRLVAIEGGGHWLMRDFPDRLLAELDGFLP